MTQTAVKERGIIFSTDLIPQVMDGPKIMTRRTWGLERINKDPDAWICLGAYFDGYGDKWRFRRHGIDEEHIVKCPYGQVGDRLWVKETWCANRMNDVLRPSQLRPVVDLIWYPPFELSNQWHGRHRSPRFMPRWASRIDLEITNLRAERLQGITEVDAIAEGTDINYRAPLMEFRRLWDSLNAKRGYGWEVNPWVWVIGFKVCNK